MSLQRYQNKYSLKNILTIRGGKETIQRITKQEQEISLKEKEEISSQPTNENQQNEEEEEGDDFSSSLTSSLSSLPLFNYLSENWKRTPPITKFFISSSFVVTFLSYLFNNNNWPAILSLKWKYIFQLQLWRLFTSFLYFGSFGLNYLLILQFTWQYMSQIERLYYKKPEKFLSLLGFGMISLLITYRIGNLSIPFLGHNLCAYFVYIWSRIFEGIPINLMGLLTVPAEILPWLFCLQSVLIDGYFPWTDLLGIGSGHLYLLSEKYNWFRSPEFIVRFTRLPFIQKMYQKFRNDFE